jgi:trehalose-phosphatase
LARRPPSLKQIPKPFPRGLLAELASSGIGLFLDYDGTLAEIVNDPGKAIPLPGIPELIEQLASSKLPITIAIVTGRRISEVKRLLGVTSGLLFSGVHGMEFEGSDGKAEFVPGALKCLTELDKVRNWLHEQISGRRGFRIEDKEITVGLHYRDADPQEARELAESFSEFVAQSTKHLKLMQLKMLAEAMPRTAASKGHTVSALKRRLPKSYVAVYFGDDTTDEDAFRALDDRDVGVLVGEERATFARFHVSGPTAVRDELQALMFLAN